MQTMSQKRLLQGPQEKSKQVAEEAEASGDEREFRYLCRLLCNNYCIIVPNSLFKEDIKGYIGLNLH